MVLKTIAATVLMALFLSNTAMIANAQSQMQDISVALQSSLETSAPVVVYFEFDKDMVTSEAAVILEQQAMWLLQNPEAKVDLAGHTDAVGSNEYNDGLALRRAKSVEAYLFKRGVRPEQMRSVVSRGENDLAISTPKRERLNRRVTTNVTGLVELVVATPPPPPPSRPISPQSTPRTYADAPTASCTGRSRTSLMSMPDMDTLRGELAIRLDNAVKLYNDASVQAATDYKYDLAAYTKAQCGIAIGFTKKNIKDERSISNCDCVSNFIVAGSL